MTEIGRVELELARQGAVAGFEAERPACFAWLGGSMYLAAETVLGTLQAIAQFSAPGCDQAARYSGLNSEIFSW